MPLHAFAQVDDQNITGITEKEKAVMAFFHLAGMAPDYEYWIKSSSLYKTTPEEYQESIMIKEWLRLDRGYGYYNKDKGILKLVLPIEARYFDPKEDQPARFTFSFPTRQDGSTPIFNYPYGEENISMVIDKIMAFSDITLPKSQYEKIKNFASPDTEFMAQLVVYAHPTKADYASPVVINKQRHWIMVSEIAYVRCEVLNDWSQSYKKIWEYIAPWYEETYKNDNMSEEEKYPHPYDLFKKRKY